MNIKCTSFIFLLLIFLNSNTFAQTRSSSESTVVSTAVPFLTICPDARSTSLGWSGVATSSDIYSQNRNPAKYAFYKPKKNQLNDWNYRFLFKQDSCMQDSGFYAYRDKIIKNDNKLNFACIDSTSMNDEFSIGLSVTPWLRNLVSDINLMYLVGYKRLDDRQTLSASLRYFTLGDITFMSEYGDPTGQQSPNEFAIDIGYTRLLSDNFSGAVALRYIRSDITGGLLVNGVKTHAGKSFAADVSFFYTKNFKRNLNNHIFSTGLYISNIGSMISYTDGETKDFLPTNLTVGFAYTKEIDNFNSLTFTCDANKLLVPTPDNSKLDFETGLRSTKSPITGILSSFADAPGGMKEELKEIKLSGGIEFSYHQNYFLRSGFFYEDPNKGNRKFLSAGMGFNLIFRENLFSIDAAYIVPFVQNNPLANTMQLSISANF